MDDFIISKKKLEDIIFDHLTGDREHDELCVLNEDYIPLAAERQFDLGAYGIADIVTFNDDGSGKIRCDIIELKRGSIDKNALVQILRYKAGLNLYLEEKCLSDYFTIGYLFLIGGYISTEDDFNLIPSSVDGLRVFTYDINAYGLTLHANNSWRFDDNKFSKNNTTIVCADYQMHDQEADLYYDYKNGAPIDGDRF